MENKLNWQNTELKPEESFEKGEYEELLKYVKENEQALISAFTSTDSSAFDIQLNLMLKYGSAKLGYFEQVIHENPMFYTLFKLGELNGHIDAFNSIEYEKDQKRIAMRRFFNFKASHITHAALAEAIIKQFYLLGGMNLEKLTELLSSEEESTYTTLNCLTDEGFLDYEGGNSFALTDLGLRVGKQLSE